ncbi:MAG TPA: GAF domain-containing sensor histidine kinase [Terriglobales bacterium]|nr:GAF domain-containing sensor histidine kinase [Terriglobales bacterium]
MRFTVDPHRFLSRLKTSTAPGELRRVERVLATTRLFLATSFLAAIYVVPTEPGHYSPLVYLLLFLYLIHSFVIMVLARIRLQPTLAFRLFVHGADIVWPTVVSLYTKEAISPFFLFFLFVLLEAAYRWGLWETLATSVASIALLAGENAVAHWISLPAAFQIHPELNRLLLSAAYLLSMGLLIGYLAENEKQLRAEKAMLSRILGLARVDVGLTGSLQQVFAELIQLFGAGAALLVIEESHSSRISGCEAKAAAGDDVEFRWLSPGEVSREAYLFPAAAHTWFAARTARSVSLLALDDAGSRMRKLAPDFLSPLLAARQFRSVLAVSLTTTDEWFGRLYLFDPTLAGDREEALRFLQDLVRQVGPAVSNVYLLARLRQRAGAIERARVARELHDGAVQSLISVEMQVDVLRRRAGGQPNEVVPELGRIQKLLREEVLKLRDLMQQMKPLAVDAKTLVPFLQDTVAKFQRETGISARFTCQEANIELPPKVCREVARIVQEGLVNVRKHSRAEHVVVQVRAAAGNYHLVIQDDGAGFEFSGRLCQTELESQHKGPAVIRERVRSIEGELTVESVPGHGSRLDVVIPQKQRVAYA